MATGDSIADISVVISQDGNIAAALRSEAAAAAAHVFPSGICGALCRMIDLMLVLGLYHK